MPDNILARLSIRQGIAADLPLVKQICADVYGGNDYIPELWEEWTAIPQNRPFIVEMDGQPAGLYFLRLGVARSNTGWIQGVRVAASFRKHGIARFILEQAIRQSRELGLGYLQYATAQDNLPMHRLAGLYNFHQIGNFLNFNFKSGKTLAHGSALASRLVTTSEFDEAYRLLLESAEYRLGHGIYCNAWNWKPLDLDTFRQHLERREVYCLTGALKVLAIMHRAENDSYWIAFLAGELTARLALLQELAGRVTKRMVPDQNFEFTAQLIQTPNNEAILKQAGFEPDEYEPVISLYELNLEN
jgi:GNAT superfamily N-acetyltransferase